MEEKIGAGGKNQPYEKSNGQYARTEDSYTDTANSLIIWAKSQNIELPLNSDGSANISKLVEIRKEKEPPVNLEGNNRFRRNTSAYFSSLTKKQAGVIFAANKNGNITLPDAAIKYMYRHFVDVRGYNNNHNQQDVYDKLQNGVELIFQKRYKEAESEIVSAFRVESLLYNSKELSEIKRVFNF